SRRRPLHRRLEVSGARDPDRLAPPLSRPRGGWCDETGVCPDASRDRRYAGLLPGAKCSATWLLPQSPLRRPLARKRAWLAVYPWIAEFHMTRTQTSTIAFAFSALFAGQAMAQNTGPVTREQVKAELAQAIQNGDMIINESGARLNQMFPHNYPQRPA